MKALRVFLSIAIHAPTRGGKEQKGTILRLIGSAPSGTSLVAKRDVRSMSAARGAEEDKETGEKREATPASFLWAGVVEERRRRR